MAYVLLKDGSQESTAAFISLWNRYREYLASISGRLPQSARAFALAEWHHDFNDHRALHDSWVESVLIFETATGEQQEYRQTHIKLRLLGAYHDGHIELEYTNVTRYSIGSDYSDHGDWLYDEIRLSESGLVLHEIEIGGKTWIIEAEDICYSWMPLANSTVENDATPAALTTRVSP